MKVSLIPIMLLLLQSCGIDYSPQAKITGGSQTGTTNYTLTKDVVTVMYNGGTVTFDPRLNDSSTSSTISAISTPAYGSAIFTDSEISFTPDSSYIGVVYFDYTVNSGGQEKIGQVAIQLMHQFTWTGAISSDFSTAGNWCNTVTTPGLSGTCTGGAAPNNTQHAYIDESCTDNCEVIIPAGATIDLKGLTLRGSTLTKTTTAVLNIDSEGFTQTGGTFNGGTGNVNVVNFGGFQLLKGTFNAPAGTFPGTGTLKINRGQAKFSSDATFNHNSSTVQLGGGWNGALAMRPFNTRFHDVRLYSDGDVTYTDLYGTLFVDNNLYIMDSWNAGTINNNGTIKLKGDLFIENEGLHGNSMIELTGNPAGQTIHGVTNADTALIPGLRIKTGGYPVTMTGKFTISYGGLEGISAGTMTTAGSVMRFGLLGSCASIPVNGGPIQFGDVELMEGCNYFDMRNASTKVKSLKFSTFTQTSIDDGSFDVSGDLDMSSAGNYFGDGFVKLTGNPAGQTITGGTALIPGLEIAAGTNPVTLTGRVQIFRYLKMTSVGTFNTAGSLLALSGICTDFTLIPGSAVYGDVSFGSTCNMNFDLQNGTMKIAGDLFVGDTVVGNSGMRMSNGTIEAAGDVSIDVGGFDGNGVVKMVSAAGGKSLIANHASAYLNHLTIDAGAFPVTLDGPHNLNVGRGYRYLSSGAFTHNNTLTLGDGGCVGDLNATMGSALYNNLHLDMTCRNINFQSSVDVAGNVTVNPFVLGAGQINMPNPGAAYHFNIGGTYTGNGVVFNAYGATLNFVP